MSALIDGATLSALLFSHMNSPGCQYGFLLGERVEQIEDRISDSQIHTADVNSYTYVSSFVPWPSPDCVYSRTGCLDEDAVAKLLPDKDQALVGWYSFRHQTSLRPSLREVTLHHNITSCKRFQGEPQDLYFFLCTSSIQPQGSTHTCNHGFLHLVNGSFAKIPMSVMNLGDTTRTEYRKRSNATLSHSSTIQNTFQKHRKDFLQPTGEMDQVVKVDRLANSVNKSLMSMYTKVSQSEATLGLLEIDVRNLKSRVEMLEQEEMSRIFAEEESKRKEEEEISLREDEKLEAEEQSQLNKLMLDLDLLTDADQAATWGQAASSSASNQPHDTDPSTSLDLSSYVHIDKSTKVDSNGGPEYVIWTEPPSTGAKEHTGRVMEKTVTKNKVQGSSTKTEERVEHSVAVSTDPFASLGNVVVELQKDLNGPDSKGVTLKDTKQQRATLPSTSANNHSSAGTKSAQASSSGMNSVILHDKTMSKPKNAKLPNGNAESEDSDSQPDNTVTNHVVSSPEAHLGDVNETIPSSSPLF